MDTDPVSMFVSATEMTPEQLHQLYLSTLLSGRKKWVYFSYEITLFKCTMKVIGDFSWFSQIPSEKRDDYQTHFMWKKTLGICWGGALLMANFNCA